MPIICLEGASAVGKTTTATCLKANDGVFIVPEVNLLFERPENASAEWYFERQVERWRIAREQNAIHRLVILDGDPFQPLWYSWAYQFLGWQSLDFMEQFYRPKIQYKTLAFPDRYVIFDADEAELRKRRDRDTTRQRRGFETHLRMIEPQRRYFQAMQKISPHRVRFLEAKTVETNVELIREDVSGAANFDEIEAGTLFDHMIEWLRQNGP